jgi:uncharacterized protein Yka (UPF0111/DUF47 family)|tara:strand:+ start:644 stop:988 length:345 start_codon:yes stop_codon:yes gene_type:complete
MIEELIERLFHARNAAHIAHWKTKSYAEHKALGHYYEDVIAQLDNLIEAYQGTFGIIGKVDEQEKDISKIIHDDIIWLNENRNKVAKGVSALENIVDELTATHMKTLYKLENLR